MSLDGFQSKLLPNEHILWQGTPARGVVFTSRDIFLIPFSAIWLGFVVFWLSSVMKTNAPWFFPLWGLMFLGIGLFFAIGRFFVDAWLRARTQYAVTDQRIVIMRRPPLGTFTSIELDRLPEITLTGEGAQKGNIRFGPNSMFSGNRQMAGWVASLDSVPQFLGVRDPSALYRLIMEASRKARTRE